jgi:hypothetical protein
VAALARIAIVLLVGLSSLTSGPASARADEAWSEIRTRDGVTYEKRAVPGSKFYEYRATVVVPVPPAVALDAVWSTVTETIPTSVQKRQIVSRSADELVVYDQIRTPIVSDRDVAIRMRRSVRPDGGEVRFDSDPSGAPPPDPKHVRVPIVRGGWTVTTAPGGSRLVYTCYSEPGGSVPAFLVRGFQQDQVATDVGNVLRRIRAHHP